MRSAIGVGVVLATVVAVTAASSGHESIAASAPRATTCSTPRPGFVAAENRLPGSTGWAPQPGAGRDIAGYADATSVRCGSTLRLFVSTAAKSYRVEAWRLGYYGGAGGRLVWTSAPIPGRRQRGPIVDPTTLEVRAGWFPTARITVTPAYVPGDYVLRLVPSTGRAGYIPLTVTVPAGAPVAATVVHSTATWQTYNAWGGYSGYHGPDGSSETRSRVVSFERPYDKSGANEYFAGEYPLTRFLEFHGIDAAYETSEDLDAGIVPAHTRVILSAWHAEYVTTGARNALDAATRRGVNLAFFGGNQIYWRPAYRSDAIGPRRELVIYRTREDDPYAENAGRATERWRDTPIDMPEQLFLGSEFTCLQVDAPVQVSNNWLFAGTGLHVGDEIPHLSFQEVDEVMPGPSADVRLLSRSTFYCGSRSSMRAHDIVVRSTPSGAAVFNAGTLGWVCRLAASCAVDPTDQRLQRIVSTMTWNVLAPMLRGPAGFLAAGQAPPTTVVVYPPSADPPVDDTADATTSGDVEDSPAIVTRAVPRHWGSGLPLPSPIAFGDS